MSRGKCTTIPKKRLSVIGYRVGDDLTGIILLSGLESELLSVISYRVGDDLTGIFLLSGLDA